MALPEIGKSVPDFSLLNQHGETIELKSFRGKNKVIIYFYPKASTPGCTVQACGMRDYMSALKELNTQVLAISPDLPAKLLKFDAQYSLDFNLLSDPEHLVADAYGAWGLKKFMGREFMGILRTTFIVDEKGFLLKILDKINTKTHSSDVIAYIKDIT